MKYIKLIIKLIINIRNIFLLIFFTRLLFVEPNQIALIAELIAGMGALLNPVTADAVDDWFSSIKRQVPAFRWFVSAAAKIMQQKN